MRCPKSSPTGSVGEYIADYVEIARLGDAFVVLIERDTVETKLRFLDSKGVQPEVVKEVMRDRGAEELEMSQPERAQQLTQDLIRRVISEPGLRFHTSRPVTEKVTPASTGEGNESDGRPRWRRQAEISRFGS